MRNIILNFEEQSKTLPGPNISIVVLIIIYFYVSSLCHLISLNIIFIPQRILDDEPDDGPQHYVFISGFHNPHLLTYLADISIFVDCIIKVRPSISNPLGFSHFI